MSTEGQKFVDTLINGDEGGEVPRRTRRTLQAVASLMHERPNVPDWHRRCYAGQSKLALRAGASVRTVRNHLKMLEKQAVIFRTRKARAGAEKQGVTETIYIIGFSDLPVELAGRSEVELENSTTTNRQFANSQAASDARPSGNPCGTYRETKVITQIDQKRKEGSSSCDYHTLIPQHWRKDDLEWLLQAAPRHPLPWLLQWLWDLERSHGRHSVDAALKSTRQNISVGDVTDPLAYIKMAVIKASSQTNASIAPLVTEIRRFKLHKGSSERVVRRIFIAKPSAALIKHLRDAGS